MLYWGLRLLPPTAALLVFALARLLGRQNRPGRVLLRTYQELTGLLREKEQGSGWYQKRAKWLLKNGAEYHYGKHADPVGMLAAQLALGALGAGAVSGYSPVLALAVGAALCFLPPGLLVYLNYQDNQRLLPELKLVYHAMEIRIRAGVYVTDALAECYGAVREKRLRGALLALAGDIVMKADIYDAVNRFQEKFDNRHIDSLCIIVLQALESGQAVELLGDIGEQIRDMEAVVLERKKARLDRSITICQLCVLAVVLGITLYACVSYMFRAAAGF